MNRKQKRSLIEIIVTAGLLILCIVLEKLVLKPTDGFSWQPLCHKADADIAHAGDFPDGVLHFCGAVGAIQVFHNKHFFHDGFPFVL